MSTKFLDLNKSPYDCLIEDAEDCQNLNNYRNEKGKSSRLDGYDYLVSFAQYNIYGRNFFVFGGGYTKQKQQNLSIMRQVDIIFLFQIIMTLQVNFLINIEKDQQ